MKILLYHYSSFEQTKIDLKREKFDILIFVFNDRTPYFLSRKYYKVLDFLKQISVSKNVDIIYVFYVKKEYRNLVNGLYISSGIVKRVYGEFFSDKCCLIKSKDKIIQVMFYYDLYANRNVFNNSDIDLFIGLDNFNVDNLKFLQNKFFNKLIVVDGDGNVYNQKNVENIAEKVGKYYIQI